MMPSGRRFTRLLHRLVPSILFAVSGTTVPGTANALPDFLTTWQAIYPNSTSDLLHCQLCHANAGGNSPWNEYGREIMEVYHALSQSSIANAITTTANLDSDGDSATNVTEINNNDQPGWVVGNNNTFYEATGENQNLQVTIESSGNPPPSLPDPDLDPVPGDIPMGTQTLSLHEVATGFTAPLKAVKAPGIDGSLFVVEQGGRIVRVDLSTGDKSLFYDISADLVALQTNYDERGLLGLAFHPEFARNGLFYTFQSEAVDPAETPDFSTTSNPDHRSKIVKYWAYDPSCNSPISKLEELLVIDQPQSNHNGGDLAFGPDGFLYIGVGDGGAQNDIGDGHGATGNGQNIDTALGAILRIDVDGSNSINGRYGIPQDNPFVGISGLDEIFAYGFRNPFRLSFDSDSGNLYTGDVGQNAIEEVNLVESAGNYGWNWKEGDHYFIVDSGGAYVSQTAPPGAPLTGLTDPIIQYDHDEGISVIGGYVYRGSDFQFLGNHYVFADYFRIGGLDGGRRLLYADLSLGTPILNEFAMDSLADNVTGFGQDSENELYITTNPSFSPTNPNGRLLKLLPTGTEYAAPDGSGEDRTCRDYCTVIKSGSRRVPLCM